MTSLGGSAPRRKGSDGERELCRLLAAELGAAVTRNLAQSREGGHDLNGEGPLLPWCLEVKRTRRATPSLLRAWWAQAQAQAERAGKLPALCYREDRAAWCCVIPLAALWPGLGSWQGIEWTATLSLQGFCTLLREGLPPPPPGAGPCRGSSLPPSTATHSHPGPWLAEALSQ